MAHTGNGATSIYCFCCQIAISMIFSHRYIGEKFYFRIRVFWHMKHVVALLPR